MKRVATALMLFLLATGLLSSTASGADLGGGVHLRVGGRYLQLDIATTAPIIVYDGVYYQQTVETTSMLVPVTMNVPQTSAVMVPPYASEILINGVSYPLEPERGARTIEVVTGTSRRPSTNPRRWRRPYTCPRTGPPSPVPYTSCPAPAGPAGSTLAGSPCTRANGAHTTRAASLPPVWLWWTACGATGMGTGPCHSGEHPAESTWSCNRDIALRPSRSSPPSPAADTIGGRRGLSARPRSG